MEQLNHPLPLAGFGFLSGIALHLGLFVHGEWHVQAPSIAVTHFLLFCVFPLVAFGSRSPVISETFWSIVLWSYGYLPGLFASMLVYRSFFHPLRRAGFKGPWYASVSKLWHVWACRGSKNHRVMAKLHEQYGDFVRTGPSEIAVFHPDVYMTIDGPRSECVKAEWYDLLHPSLALVTSRDKTIHGSRRREWNQGFTTKALVDHEEKVFKFIDQLDDCLETDAVNGYVSDMRNLLLWFGFDYMGDFVFSKSFNMLKERQWHHIIVRLQRALSLLGPFSPAPWLVQVGFNLAPRVNVLKDWFDTVAWCQSQMTTRLKNPKKGVSPDLTYFLMESDGGNLADESKFFWLAGDSLLAIVAGSEPTAVALIAVFCELGKHPEHADQIYEEIKDVDPRDLKTLTALPHLNAVIKEALRMHPALLTGGNRKTTENGITIGGTFIPPHTTIVAPRFSIQRREDCFERAQEFIPERWTTQPSLIRNLSAYAPFGTGHHSCLGRTLANDIMRFVLAKILQKYTFSAADGADSLNAMDSVKDQFTSNPGRLDLRFQLRQRS